MKKLIALAMVLGLIVAACGGDSSTDDTTTTAAPDPGTPTTAAPSDAEPDDAPDPEPEPSTDDMMELEELNVAYFLEWPTANQYAQANMTYDDVLGIPVNWTPFANGNAMAEAMESGDVDISYSQGLTPFANFVTAGSDLLLVGVAVTYADADNCVAHPDFGITAANASETLAGQSIYTPLGNVTHFKLLKMLEHLGVDTASVELIQSEGGPAAVAALEAGEVAMACAFGGAVNQMLENGGNLVMTGAEQEAIGIRVFDIISTTGDFAENHPDVVTAFLQVTEDANRAYNDHRDPFIDTIADAAGMDREPTVALLDAFGFPERDVQLSDAWLGGTVQSTMKEQMDFFVAQGEIESALASYDDFVDTSFLEAVVVDANEPDPPDDAMDDMMMTPDELNVAYFLEWPTANQYAQANMTYDDVLGIPVNWTPFANGNAMAEAMESGDVDISYSQGLTPFANFVTAGSDLLLVGVAVTYADADNCVAHPDFGITAANASETLAGQSIYTPLGNVTHFKLLKMLEHLGVDTASVELIQSEGGPAAVAALEAGEVAMACAFGGAVNQMLENGGNLVMTGAEQEAIGIRVFDIISTTGDFADTYPDVVTAFLQVTEDANRAYNDDREPFIDTIAGAAGMDREPTIALLDAFGFPERDVQLSDAWLGGTVQATMKEQMDFFVAQGEIETALRSYDDFVDTTFLEAVR